jgi:hypothetical protein
MSDGTRLTPGRWKAEEKQGQQTQTEVKWRSMQKDQGKDDKRRF